MILEELYGLCVGEEGADSIRGDSCLVQGLLEDRKVVLEVLLELYQGDLGALGQVLLELLGVEEGRVPG